ncbi:MAG: DUF748 domain-containing protein [Deltaproteobacteria bacterium]|nr:DUF748 domain-containing protein [Deltaproteobacteria bacterium]
MGIRLSCAGFSRTKKGVVIAAVFVVLYAIFGFLIAPSILKSNLISGIAEQLDRKATVSQIRVNPFALSATLRGFQLNEPDDERFFSFEELYVNFQLSSILRRAYTFDEIRLIAPDGRIKVLPDGSLNFSDLLTSWEATESTPDESDELPPVVIFRLQVEQGRLAFSDLSRPTPFETELSPIGLTFNNFSTRKDSESPYAFTATTGEGGVLSWEGDFSVNPLRSQGRFALIGITARTLWKYFQDQVRFEVHSGSINLAARYDVAAGGKTFELKLIDGALKLNEFTLAEKGINKTLISVPLFSVSGADIDLPNKRAVFASVSSSGAGVEGWLAPDGTLNYHTLLAMDGLEDKAEESSGTPDQSGAESQPWQITVNELTLEDCGVTLEDRTLAEPVRVTLEQVNLNLKNVSNQKNSQAEVLLALTVNQTGTVELKGLAGINPVSTEFALKVARIALKPFQSYVDAVAKLDLVSGTVSLEGDFKYRSQDGHGPEMRYRGGVSVDSFEAVNRLQSEDFLKWKSLALNGLLLDIEPDKLSISEIVANQPYARIIIWPDKTVNLTRVFSTQDDDGAHDADAKGRAVMPVTIDAVRIENGSANFADLWMKPNFATGIQGLNGTIKGLSSEPSARADVLIEGKVDEYAPVRIAGQINALSPEAYADVALSFKNMELSTLTPYSGKFVGYTIEKGKMSLDLKYKLSENVLVGENKIVLNRLTLGERIDSADATKLPVRLAIALLKDRNGRIDIDLPVRGDLNNPEFNYGRIIARALVNLITKIVTFPFAILGGLIGGDGEKLSFVEFEFGSAALGAGQMNKLDKLAEALHERPNLRLEIRGAADSGYDREALAEAQLLSQLKHARLEELRAAGVQGPVHAEEVSLSDDDHSRLITQAYVDRFAERPEALFTVKSGASATDEAVASGALESSPETDGQPAKRPPIEPRVLIAAAKQRLIRNMAVDEIALRRLAQERARQIKGHLIQQGEIPDERVFMIEVEIDGASDGDAIRSNLTLSGT